MNNIIAKISFLHNARPYTSADEYANISFSFPVGALPNTGDIVQIAGISHPMGAFVVAYRVFEVQMDSLYAVTLTLGVEGLDDGSQNKDESGLIPLVAKALIGI